MNERERNSVYVCVHIDRERGQIRGKKCVGERKRWREKVSERE